MTEFSEQPKQSDTRVPEISEFFNNKILDQDYPKYQPLEKWFNYFDELGKNDNLISDRLPRIKTEFTIAYYLSQQHMNDQQNKELSFNAENLKDARIDTSRLARYLILQVAYPKGIDLNNNELAFTLDSNDIERLKEIVNKMPNLENTEILSILETLNFEKNESGTYTRHVKKNTDSDLNYFLKQIIFMNN